MPPEPKPDTPTWAVKVRTLLKAQKKTMAQLGRHMRITEGAVSHKLRGHRETTMDEAEQIADFLGFSAAELLDDTGLLELLKPATPEQRKLIREVIEAIVKPASPAE